MSKNAWCRCLALVLVCSFISMDIAWAYPPDQAGAASRGSTLATQIISQAQMMTGSGEAFKSLVASDARLAGSVFAVAKILLDDKLPLEHLDQVLTAELTDALAGIDLSRVTVENGVTLIPYTGPSGSYVIQVVPHDAAADTDLVGFEWKLSDKYTVYVVPRGFAGTTPSAVRKEAASRETSEPSVSTTTETVSASLDEALIPPVIARSPAEGGTTKRSNLGKNTTTGELTYGDHGSLAAAALLASGAAQADAFAIDRAVIDLYAWAGSFFTDAGASIWAHPVLCGLVCAGVGACIGAALLVRWNTARHIALGHVKMANLTAYEIRHELVTSGRHAPYTVVKHTDQTAQVWVRAGSDEEQTFIKMRTFEIAPPSSGGIGISGFVARLGTKWVVPQHEGALRIIKNGEYARTSSRDALSIETLHAGFESDVSVAEGMRQGVIYMKSGAGNIRVGGLTISVAAGDVASVFGPAIFTAATEDGADAVIVRTRDEFIPWSLKDEQSAPLAAGAAAPEVYRNGSGEASTLSAVVYRAGDPVPQKMTRIVPFNAPIDVGVKTAQGSEAAHYHSQPTSDGQTKSRTEIIICREGEFTVSSGTRDAEELTGYPVSRGDVVIAEPYNVHALDIPGQAKLVIMLEAGKPDKVAVPADMNAARKAPAADLHVSQKDLVRKGIRPFGKTGLTFFALGAGTIWFGRQWPAGNASYAAPTDEEIEVYLEQVFARMGNDEGVVMLDTAAAYGLTEERLGTYFATHPGMREKAFISTKWGEEFDIATGSSVIDHSAARLTASVDRSLTHLGTIDLLYIHGTTVDVLKDAAVIDEMRRMKAQRYGGISYLGASISDARVLETAVNENLLSAFDAVQMPAPIFLKRGDLVAELYKQGIAIVVNSPTRKGDGRTVQEVYGDLLSRKELSVILTGARQIPHLAQNVGHIRSQLAANTTTVLNWLAERDELPPAYDLLWVMGSKDWRVAEKAAEFWMADTQSQPGSNAKILITGGVGHHYVTLDVVRKSGDPKAAEIIAQADGILDELALLQKSAGQKALVSELGKRFAIAAKGKNTADVDRFQPLLAPATRYFTPIPEALLYMAVMRACGVDKESILIEAQSTSTVDNVRFGAEVLARQDPAFYPQKVVLMQTTPAQRRAKATFRAQYPAKTVECYSNAPDLHTGTNAVSLADDAELLRMARFVELEVGKLEQYAGFGKTAAVDVPPAISALREMIVDERQAFQATLTPAHPALRARIEAPAAKILNWLAERDPLPADFDLLWVMGSKDWRVAVSAAQFWSGRKVKPKILITGGVGRLTASIDTITKEFGEENVRAVRNKVDEILDGLAELRARDGDAAFWRLLEDRYAIRKGLDAEKQALKAAGKLSGASKLWRDGYEKALSGAELDALGRGRDIEEIVFARLLDRATRYATPLPEGILYYATMLVEGVSDADIMIESQSTTTVENVTFGAAVLAKRGLTPQSIVLMQVPHIQKRAAATLKKHYPLAAGQKLYSHAPYTYEGDKALSAMTEDEVLTLAEFAATEVSKFPEYEAFGNTVHVDVDQQYIDARLSLMVHSRVPSTYYTRRKDYSPLAPPEGMPTAAVTGIVNAAVWDNAERVAPDAGEVTKAVEALRALKLDAMADEVMTMAAEGRIRKAPFRGLIAAIYHDEQDRECMAISTDDAAYATPDEMALSIVNLVGGLARFKSAGYENDERTIAASIILQEKFPETTVVPAEELARLIDGTIGAMKERPGTIGRTIAESAAEGKFRDGAVVYLPREEKTAYAITDVHGDLASLEAILREIDFERRMQKKKDAVLVFLGDYENNGNDGLGVLARVMRLKVAHPDNVVLLRGNNEDLKTENKIRGWYNEEAKYAHDGAAIEERYGASKRDQQFPFELQVKYGFNEGKRLEKRFDELFEAMPAVAVSATGIVFAHSAPPARKIGDEYHCDIDLTGIARDAGPLDQPYSWQMRVNSTWTTPNAVYGDTTGPMARGYEIREKEFTEFLEAVGANVFVGGHVSLNAGQIQFAGRMAVLHSTNALSPNCGSYLGVRQDVGAGCYGQFSLQDDQKTIVRAKNIVPVPADVTALKESQGWQAVLDLAKPPRLAVIEKAADGRVLIHARERKFFNDYFESIEDLYRLQKRVNVSFASSLQNVTDPKAEEFIRIVEDGTKVDYAVYDTAGQLIGLYTAAIPAHVLERRDISIIALQNVGRANRPGAPNPNAKRPAEVPDGMKNANPDRIIHNNPLEVWGAWAGPSANTWWLLCNSFPIWPNSTDTDAEQPYHFVLGRGEVEVPQSDMAKETSIRDVLEFLKGLNTSPSIADHSQFRAGINGWYASESEDAIKAGASQYQAHAHFIKTRFPIENAETAPVGTVGAIAVSTVTDEAFHSAIVLDASYNDLDELAAIAAAAVKEITSNGRDSFNIFMAPHDGGIRLFIADKVLETPNPFFTNAWAFSEFSRMVVIDAPEVFYAFTPDQRKEYDAIVNVTPVDRAKLAEWIAMEKAAGRLSAVAGDIYEKVTGASKKVSAEKKRIDILANRLLRSRTAAGHAALEKLALPLYRNEQNDIDVSPIVFPATPAAAQKFAGGLSYSYPKYDKNGDTVPFDGVTLVSSAENGNYPLFRSIVKRIDEWQRAYGKKLIATMVPGSEHLTLYDLIAEDAFSEEQLANPDSKFNTLRPELKKVIEEKAMAYRQAGVTDALRKAAYETVSVAVHEALAGFDAGRVPVFKPVRIGVFMPQSPSALVISMEPKTKEDLVAVTRLQDVIREKTGIENFFEYKAHISLGYIVGALHEDEDVFNDFKKLVADLNHLIGTSGSDAELALTQIELSYFRTMDAFPSVGQYPWTGPRAGAELSAAELVARLDALEGAPLYAPASGRVYAPEAASAEARQAARLFELVEKTVNNSRAQAIADANTLLGLIGDRAGISTGLTRGPLDKKEPTAAIAARVREIIAHVKALDDATLSPAESAAYRSLVIQEKSIEADAAVGSFITLARRAKREGQSLIVGLETDWIPGYNAGGIQRQLLGGLVHEIETLPDALRAMGLDNVIVVRSQGAQLAGSLIEEAGKARTDYKNVVILASQETIGLDAFDPFRSDAQNERAFLAKIDSKKLRAWQEANSGIAVQLDIDILELVLVTLEFAVGKERPHLAYVKTYDRVLREIVFELEAEPFDYQKIYDRHKAERGALQAA